MIIRSGIVTLALAVAFRAAHPAAPIARRVQITRSDSTDAWFRFFAGRWHCAGGFPSGRKLEATVTFTPDLGGKWLEYRHADVAPGTYRAGALWGQAGKDSGLVSLLHDNGGGVRLYRSAGWMTDALVWTRDTSFRVTGPPVTTVDRFTYRRNSDSTFWFGWELGHGGMWAVGDSLTCRRT